MVDVIPQKPYSSMCLWLELKIPKLIITDRTFRAEKNLKVVCKAGCDLRKYPGKPVKLVSKLLLSVRGREGKWGVGNISISYEIFRMK